MRDFIHPDSADADPRETISFGEMPRTEKVIPLLRSSYRERVYNAGVAADSQSIQELHASACHGYQGDFQFQEDELLSEANFRSRLVVALKAEPIEDGVGHKGEIILEEALVEFHLAAPTWIQAAFTEMLGMPALAAGLLQCVGRLKYSLVKGVGPSLVIAGLQQRSIEVREAAISAIEQWGGDRFLGILRRHQDPVPWLADYVARVVQDLSRI